MEVGEFGERGIRDMLPCMMQRCTFRQSMVASLLKDVTHVSLPSGRFEARWVRFDRGLALTIDSPTGRPLVALLLALLKGAKKCLCQSTKKEVLLSG